MAASVFVGARPFASQFHRLEQTQSNCRLGPFSRALVEGGMVTHA